MKCIVSLLTAVLAFGILSTGVAMAEPPSPPAYTPAPAAPAPEAHPHIRGAIRELREAKHELETAAHDFGGHRKEAIEAIDNAINQLQQALDYDKH